MKEIELINKRKKREKHFLKEDGSIVAVMYNDNVHFEKNGNYEEIDNTLVEENDCYYNRNNDYKVCFNKINKESIMNVEKDGHYIDIQLKNSNEVEIKKIEKNDNLFETIYYENIYEMTDLEYQLLPTKIKETIVLKNKEAIKDKISFIIKSDLELILTQYNSIAAKKDNEIVFQMDAPYMIDSSGKLNQNIRYELSVKDDSYKLDLILDTKWLKSDSTIFPVYIDPTITNSSQTNSVEDTYIYPGDTGVDKNSLPYIKIGVEKVNGNNVTNRALLKFDLPEIGTASEVIKADLILQTYYGNTENTSNVERTLEVHKITTNWNEQDANWQQMSENYDPKVETLQFLSRRVRVDGYEFDENGNLIEADYDLNSYSQMYSDITNLVKHWYKDTPNNGIMIKANPEVYIDDNYPLVYSKNNTINEGLKPLLEITYRNQNGLESYMNYKTQAFTDGNMYLNTYNGNLVGVFNVGSTFNSKLPVNLNLIYNTNDVLIKQNGFKFNLNQTIRQEAIEEIDCIEYEDEDCTIHYFYRESENSNKYCDEDGLGLVLEKDNLNYYMTDKNGNRKTFIKTSADDDYYYLNKIEDVSLNSIDITLNADNKITRILDGNNLEITITYETNKITVVSPDRTTILNYNNNNVISISTLNGITGFTYDTNNLISTITDVSGMKINYEYYEQKPNRVSKVTQYSNNNTVGNYFSVVYDFDSTSIIDNKGKVNTLIFNSLGNLQSSNVLPSSEDISSAYSVTEEYGDDFNHKNKLLSSVIPIKYVKNYLKNTSFETDDVFFESSSNLTTSFSTEYAVTGYRSLKLKSTEDSEFITLSTSLPTGNHYTFSGYFKSDTDLTMNIGYVDSNGEIIKKSVLIESSEEFSRNDVSIYFDAGESANMLIVEIIQENAGTTYIDNIQLEEGEVANNYNIVENSDFSKGLSDWILEATVDDYTDIDEWGFPKKVNADIGEVFNVVQFNNNKNTALEITMNPIGRSGFKKVFPIKGKKGDVYNISFWAKNDGLVGNQSYVGNAVMIYFKPIGHDADYCIMHSDNFIPNEKWQFISYRYVAEEDYESITLDFRQGRQANKMLITNLTFYKDLNTDYYNYDEEENLTSIVNSDGRTNVFEYNKDNQLINITTPRGKNFKYEYDNNNTNMIKNAISSMGICNEIKYDSNNNPITTTISKKSVNELNNGNYKIRSKGTEEYIKAEYNLVLMEENSCSNTIWKLEKINNDFKIINLVSPDFSLTCSDNSIILGSTSSANLFTLEKNSNGSYYIKLSNGNKYIKTSNSSLELATLVNDDHNFEFYFENIPEMFIENQATYSEDGRFIETVTDSNFNTTCYIHDDTTGLVTSITNANEVTTNYTYNDKRQLTNVTTDNKSVTYTYNSNNTLDKIIQDNKTYKFSYDDFLNIKKVNIGDNITLVTNEYEENNGNLIKSTYGNNHEVTFNYDDFDRIKTVHKMDNDYNYKYDNNGNLSKVISSDHTTKYTYDTAKRVEEYKYDDFKINYNYDSNDNVISKGYKLGDVENSIINTFNEDDLLTKTVNSNSEFNYQYDGLGRLINKDINGIYNTMYEYVSNGKRTSELVKSIKNGNNKYSYKYDKLNNITEVYYNDELVNKYSYDVNNQLLSEENYQKNEKIIYLYDNFGNLTTKTVIDMGTNNAIKTDTYQYTNTNWQDQLTSFNNSPITYDAIGNPLTMGSNITLSWINGRSLNSYIDNSKNLSISYKYNREGIRTSKVVNGVETKYYLEGNSIIYEQRGNNLIYYLYDLTGLIGIKYNGNIYHYTKNLQGDIIGLLDINNEQIVSYEYDSWGSLISIKDQYGNVITDGNNIGIINPFRYREYYYDSEIGMYYLNSRYYNPIWGRFINADGIIGANQDILGYNLYAYVSNNPVMFSDQSGNGLISWIVSLFESAFDYSIKKATKGTNIKVENPIKNKKASKSQKQTSDAMVNIVANSKISYSLGVSVSSGNKYAALSYGQTVAPNSGINKENVTAEIGKSYGYSFPITPSASFSFQTCLNNPIDFLNDNNHCLYNSSAGFGFNAVESIGLGYNFMERSNLSISPSVGLDIGIGYTWEWDK